MSMSKNIARLAVTAGLTAALSFGGVMAPVTMAFAENNTTLPNNSITITQSEGNASYPCLFEESASNGYEKRTGESQ